MWAFWFPLPGWGGILRRMREMRRVGVVAVGVVVVAVLVGCGAEGDGRPGAAGSSSSTPAPEPTVEPEPVETVSEPEFPPNAAGDLDRKAQEEGWVYDSLYDSASALVLDMCESMTAQKEVGNDPGNFLARHARDNDNRKILKAGWKDLCPEWEKVGLAALNGDYVREYTEGTYVVKAKPKDPDPSSEEQQEIGPGTYRTSGDLEGCYWERTTRGGDIIDNNFATSAQEITVTIRSSDGQFTSTNCGVWKKVG